jgi:RNA 2',3'-cyclic 3'-phosphodiesterase
MMRVFFGLEIPAPQRSSLAVQQFLLPLPKKTDPHDFHLTLAFLGDLPEDRIEAAHHVALGLRAPGFALTIADLGLFGGLKPRVAWAGVVACPPLVHLQSKLDNALRRADFALDARRFTPHITLGRFAPPPPDVTLRLERGVAQTAFQLDPFHVGTFAMFRSYPGVATAKYQVLERYDLT